MVREEEKIEKLLIISPQRSKECHISAFSFSPSRDRDVGSIATDVELPSTL